MNLRQFTEAKKKEVDKEFDDEFYKSHSGVEVNDHIKEVIDRISFDQAMKIMVMVVANLHENGPQEVIKKLKEYINL